MSGPYSLGGVAVCRRADVRAVKCRVGKPVLEQSNLWDLNQLLHQLLPHGCRGEGWGLPIVEAMSMGLPVIATNWRWAGGAAAGGCICRWWRSGPLAAGCWLKQPRSWCVFEAFPGIPANSWTAAGPQRTWTSLLATPCPLKGLCLWVQTAAPLQVGRACGCACLAGKVWPGGSLCNLCASLINHLALVHYSCAGPYGALGLPSALSTTYLLFPPPAPGHRWANPSVQQLVRLMKHVVAHRQEATARGLAARRRMASRYSPDAVAEVVAQQLRRIEIGLAAGHRRAG